jgi:MFS family permease
MTTTAQMQTPAAGRAPRGRGYRFLFDHSISEYPATARRTGYLALAVLATIVLYYVYYTQTGVTPNILQGYHMSFGFYVGIVIVSNLIGAFASLPASQTDRLGRTNVVIYGLLIVGLLTTFGVPNASGEWGFAIVISAIGLVEGAILVATPALVRDFSPQLGRASAMGFWTIGPVAGSLITSIVANHTLSHLHAWQDQFYISGITALVVFAITLFFLRDLSSGLRDQLMVSMRDRALVEARARGLSDADLLKATSRPWQQILRWDLVGSAFGISIFLLIYYIGAGFFTIYYSTTFQNSDHTFFSVAQANGLNTWFWGADIIALIVVGLLSDRLRVRKPFMLFGTIASMVMLVLFLTRAYYPTTTGYYALVTIGVLLAVSLAITYAPWMAGYTESVEAKNPALVATGLALWGWIIRLVVGISFIFVPIVINSVSPVVNNQPYANHQINGVPMSTWLVKHEDTVNFAKEHQALLAKIQQNQAVVNALAANPSGANIAAATKALGPYYFAQLVKYQTQLKTLVQPYQAQLTYLSTNQKHFLDLQNAVNKSPSQWRHWFWVCFAGMVVFIPLIFLTRGRWSPLKAKRDAEEHERAVSEELRKLETGRGIATPA